MVNTFQQISQEQSPLQTDICPLQAENICADSQNGKKKWAWCVWRNLQKIVTLLVLVYLMVLILNLLLCKESLLNINLPIKTEEKKVEIADGQTQGQFSQISKQNILKEILNENMAYPEKENRKQASTEFQKTQATTQPKQIPYNKIKDNIQKMSSQNNFDEQIIPQVTVSVVETQMQVQNQEKSEFFNFIEDINRKIQDKQRQKTQILIKNIYNQLNETPRSILRGLSFEKTKQIINQYVQDKNSLLLKLITQNSQLNTQLSQNDVEYKKYLNSQNPIDSYTEQPLCVILSTSNNAHNFQIVRTLNSIYNQNYNNYEVFIVDRISSDKTSTMIKDYLGSNQKNIKKTSFVSVDTYSQSFALWNTAKKCQKDSLTIYLDGNSQLLGKEVFKMINYQFSEFHAHIVYGSQYILDVNQQKISHFEAINYDQSEQFMLTYRKIPRKYGRIMGFRTNSLANLPQRYLKFNGQPFEHSGIDSLAVTMFQMSCGNFKAIKQPLGLVLIDSRLQKLQEINRKHDLRQISQKLKLDIC